MWKGGDKANMFSLLRFRWTILCVEQKFLNCEWDKKFPRGLSLVTCKTCVHTYKTLDMFTMWTSLSLHPDNIMLARSLHIDECFKLIKLMFTHCMRFVAVITINISSSYWWCYSSSRTLHTRIIIFNGSTRTLLCKVLQEMKTQAFIGSKILLNFPGHEFFKFPNLKKIKNNLRVKTTQVLTPLPSTREYLADSSLK